MLGKIKNIIKNSPLFPLVKPVSDKLIGFRPTDQRCWEIILDYAKKFNVKCLVETGTHLGRTIEALKNNFTLIYSIELDEVLAKKAQDKFRSDLHIKIMWGDSAVILPQILPVIGENKILFWLDAHYSMGVTALGNSLTPIMIELKNIFKANKEVVILIDDARDFSWYNVVFRGRKDYPTIGALKKLVKELNGEYKVFVSEGIIRIHK